MLQEGLLLALIGEFVEEYSIRINLSPRTIRNKRDSSRRLLTFLDGKPLTSENTNSYLDSMRNRGVKPNSIKAEIRFLKAFLNWLVKKKKMTDIDWSDDIEVPKVHHISEEVIDIDKAEAVIMAGTEPSKFDNINHRKRKALMRLAMRIALRTGLRGTELINIRGKDLHISDATPEESKVAIMQAKGRDPQWQPLPLDMLQELKTHINDEFVFPVCIGTCNDMLKRGAILVGISKNVKMHVHILRKIFGTTLARTLPMIKVCQLMRHSDISITQKFYINYGISELGYDLSASHPLIRLALPPEEVIKTFISMNAEKYFARDKRIKLNIIQDAKNNKFTMEFAY